MIVGVNAGLWDRVRARHTANVMILTQADY